MTRTEWRDLSDSELRLRLENRGVNPVIARMLVANREVPDVVERIEKELQS